jgi:hypothetical protein
MATNFELLLSIPHPRPTIVRTCRDRPLGDEAFARPSFSRLSDAHFDSPPVLLDPVVNPKSAGIGDDLQRLETAPAVAVQPFEFRAEGADTEMPMPIPTMSDVGNVATGEDERRIHPAVDDRR